MKILQGSTIEEAVSELKKLRSWAPFRFSGVWFLTKCPDGFAHSRTKKACQNAARKHGSDKLYAISL